MRMSLASIEKGTTEKPVRVLVYGPGGMGKTTFGAGAPKPIFLAAEDGLATIDVPRWRPESYKDCLDAVDTLITETHEYRTLVVDSLDWVEPLLFSQLCTEAGVQNMEDVKYGALYKKTPNLWAQLLVKLERLQSLKKMNVVLLAHMQLRNVNNPEGPDYSTIDIKLNEKGADKIKEWCDDVLYATVETSVTEIEGKNKAKTTGVRVLRSGKTPQYFAKNRSNLPATIPLRWEDYSRSVSIGRPVATEVAKSEIESLAPRLTPERQSVLRKVMSGLTTPAEWGVLLLRVREEVGA